MALNLTMSLEIFRVRPAGTHHIFPCHAQLKEVLLPLSHPALCCCTGFTDFFRLTEALTWDLCKLSQVYELELAFLNRIPT